MCFFLFFFSFQHIDGRADTDDSDRSRYQRRPLRGLDDTPVREVQSSDVSDTDPHTTSMTSMRAKMHNLMDMAFGIIMQDANRARVSPMTTPRFEDEEQKQVHQLAEAMRPVVSQRLQHQEMFRRKPSVAWSETEEEATSLKYVMRSLLPWR